MTSKKTTKETTKKTSKTKKADYYILVSPKHEIAEFLNSERQLKNSIKDYKYEAEKIIVIPVVDPVYKKDLSLKIKTLPTITIEG